jgi:transcriptional regulator with XRE-family HTH domain
MFENLTIPQQFKLLRTLKGMTVKDTAMLADVTAATIIHFEKGRSPQVKLSMLYKLAAVLGAELDITLRLPEDAPSL